jgi:hypothetical protein
LIAIDARALAASDVTAQIDYLDPIEAFAQHFAQPGIGFPRKKGPVRDERHDAAARCSLAFEKFPDRPAPKSDRKFWKSVELVPPASVSNRLFEIVPKFIHPVADEFANFSSREPPVGRIADDSEDRLALLDPIRLVPFGAYIIGDKAQSAFGRRRARFGQRIGQEDADPLVGLQGAHRVAQPVMRNCIRADEKFETEQPRRQGAQSSGDGARTCAGFNGMSNMFDPCLSGCLT